MRPKENISFTAIDLETATASRTSICEVGICTVREGRITGTRSWLVRPENNVYSYWNVRIHGIRPEQTEDAPDFPTVWKEVEAFLADCPVLAAHNAAFDIGCLRHSFGLYGISPGPLTYYCTLRAARRIYDFRCNTLEALCTRFGIPQGTHHRAGDDAEMCARLLLRELEDSGRNCLEDMGGCGGVL